MLEWNEVPFFLAIARKKTLAKAARVLGVDQTTVGRRIASLESKLQASLFVRGRAGYALTPVGQRVLEAAVRMEEAAQEIAAQAIDEKAPVSGAVRIATTETLAEHYVVPAIAEVQARHPKITTVVRTGWVRADLLRGEADLAVRIVKPTDPRLAFRKLAELSFRYYASRDYATQRGPFSSLEGHPLLGYDDATRTDVELALQTNSARVLVAAAVAGLGVVQLPSFFGDAIPELTAILPDKDEPYRVWLVLPQIKRRVAAIRIVADAISKAFKYP